MEKLVEALGLQEKVMFEHETEDVLSCFKTADLLIHPSEDEEESMTILQAAASGMPMILSSGGISSTLFIDGESALICPADSPQCIAQKISTFLSDNRLRRVMADNAEAAVFNSIEQDYSKYLEEYSKSIERCVALQS